MGKSKLQKKLKNARENIGKQTTATPMKKPLTERMEYLLKIVRGENLNLFCGHYHINSSYIYKLLKGVINIKHIHNRVKYNEKYNTIYERVEACAYKNILGTIKKESPKSEIHINKTLALEELKFITGTPDFSFNYNKVGDVLVIEVKSSTRLIRTLSKTSLIQVWVSMDVYNCDKALVILYLIDRNIVTKNYLIKNYKTFEITKTCRFFTKELVEKILPRIYYIFSNILDLNGIKDKYEEINKNYEKKEEYIFFKNCVLDIFNKKRKFTTKYRKNKFLNLYSNKNCLKLIDYIYNSHDIKYDYEKDSKSFTTKNDDYFKNILNSLNNIYFDFKSSKKIKKIFNQELRNKIHNITKNDSEISMDNIFIKLFMHFKNTFKCEEIDLTDNESYTKFLKEIEEHNKNDDSDKCAFCDTIKKCCLKYNREKKVKNIQKIIRNIGFSLRQKREREEIYKLFKKKI